MLIDIFYIITAFLTRLIKNERLKTKIIDKLFSRYVTCASDNKNAVNEPYEVLSNTEAIKNVFGSIN